MLPKPWDQAKQLGCKSCSSWARLWDKASTSIHTRFVNICGRGRHGSPRHMSEKVSDARFMRSASRAFRTYVLRAGVYQAGIESGVGATMYHGSCPVGLCASAARLGFTTLCQNPMNPQMPTSPPCSIRGLWSICKHILQPFRVNITSLVKIHR